MSYKLEKNKRNDVFFEDAEIMYRNFSGKPSKFNASGERTFDIIIDSPEEAEQLANDTGFNVKIYTPKREGEEPVYHLKVKVGYGASNVFLKTSKGMRRLDEHKISQLDIIDFERCDVIISPRKYVNQFTGQEGVTAYLRQMVVIQNESSLDMMYADDFFSTDNDSVSDEE